MKHAGAPGSGPEAASESQSEESPDSKTSDKDDDIVDADFEVVDEADKKE